MDELKCYSGYVCFLLIDEGSKNEHYAPFLIDKTKRISVFKPGDNPFLYPSFRPYHLKYCVLKGKFDAEASQILVESIDQEEDPFYAIQKNEQAIKNNEPVVKRREETNE